MIAYRNRPVFPFDSFSGGSYVSFHQDVSVLSDDQLKVLDGDLNNLKIEDINILNATDVLNITKSTVLSDFLNKFNINVTKNDIDVCALVGICV